MTITAGHLWQQARDQHPALSALNAPWPLAVRQLGALVRDLVEKATQEVPAFFGQVLNQALPLADFDAGISLTTAIPGGWVNLWEAEVTVGTLTPIRAEFVPWEQRRAYTPIIWTPAWTFRDNVIYLLQDAAAWAQASRFALTYTPRIADPTSLQTVIPVPDDAGDYLELALAAFYLKRLRSEPSYRVDAAAVAELRQEATNARDAFLKRVFALKKRQRYIVRNVTPRI